MKDAKLVLSIFEWNMDIILYGFNVEGIELTYNVDYKEEDLDRLQITQGELQEKVSELVELALHQLDKKTQATL